VTTDTPQLRIVSDQLFTAVQRRFQMVKQMFGREGGGLAVGPKRYLFSGLLRCHRCGGSIALVCGRGRNGADRYGCAMHHQRGDSVCTNDLLVRRDELEESLLRGLGESVLRTEVVDYIVAKLEDALSEEHRNIDAELRRLRERKQQIEGEISHLIQAIAEGRASKSVMDAISERENELKSITHRLLEPENLRAIAMEHLAKLRKLVSHPQSVEQTRAVLAEHFGTFKLEPVNEKGKLTYRAHGRVDFFGDREVARTGAAGGPACTILPQAKFFVDFAA
jgi:site-specific DNA recombinase